MFASIHFTIHLGILPEHREHAARLYALAFENKFRNILGSPEEITALLQEGMNVQRCVSAVSTHNELLGIAGFHLHQTSLIDITVKVLINRYGIIRGLGKALVMSVLFSRKPDSATQLLMDGIVVKDGCRGLGIGKKLLEELEIVAIQNAMDSIKLDVIDENPKAKVLYERMGFAATKYSRTPKLVYNCIGVSGVTTMVKSL